MKVAHIDFKEILRFLEVERRNRGAQFIVVPMSDFSLQIENIAPCISLDEAKQLCEKRKLYKETYKIFSTTSVCYVMANSLKDPSAVIERLGRIDVGAMVEARYGRDENEHININKKGEVMNEQNYEYLRDQVRFTGFGDLGDDLQGMMKKRRNAFELNHTTSFNGDEVSAVLKFTKSKQSDMYFFNSYDVQMAQQGEKEPLKQTFYINNRGSSITMKEAYNMLQGRAVNKDLTNKEGEVYNTWLQLDFKNVDDKGNFRMKRYSDNYGFDLEETLKKYPIKELANFQYKDALMDSLKKGNRQSATFIKDEKEIKRFVEASPQFKTINVYGEDGRLRLQESRAAAQEVKQDETAQGQQQGSKATQGRGRAKADAMKDDAKAEKKDDTAKSRKRGKSVS